MKIRNPLFYPLCRIIGNNFRAKNVRFDHFEICHFRRGSRRKSLVETDGIGTDIGSVVSARRGGQRIKKKLEDGEDDLLTVNEPMKRSGSKRKKSKSKPYPSSKRRGSFRRFDKDEDDNEGKQ